MSKIVGNLYTEQRYTVNPSEFYPDDGELPNIPTISDESEEEKKVSKMRRSESTEWGAFDGFK